MTKNLDVANIIQNAFNERPTGVEDAFNAAIQAKMADAIESRRAEMAADMYGSADSEEVEDNTDEEDI